MRNTTRTIIAIAMIAALMLITGCGEKPTGTSAPIRERSYDPELEARIARELSNSTINTERPDNLPPEMFSRLPQFPKDFYQIRTLVRTGRITDFGNLEDRYWMQPEFFPNFEEIGVPLLQHPPKDRWGAYGIAVYPADSVSTIEKGKRLDIFFFIKSNYLVETYQGVNLVPVFPDSTSVQSGFQMPGGAKEVKQDPEKTKGYFDIQVEPNPFILEPNFPIYNINGTRKVRITITAKEGTPPGNYIIGLDTDQVPNEYEQQWLKQYLNLYTSGGMTKIERPYYQAFIQVVESETK
jgi:hypothetical protein